MSNYPAAPQYGAPYTPNGYNFPPQTTHGTGISQYQYDARIQSSYGRAHAQSPSNGVKPNPQANVNSFRTNAQRLAPPGSRVNDAFSESANQSNPSAFPLQSHPPVPIPFDSSVFSRSPIQASTRPAAQISHRFPPAEISNIQISAARQNSPQENPETRVSAISDLEDGEVDDEEIDGLLNPSQTSKMEVLSSRPSNEGENERHGLSVEALGNRHGRSANEGKSPNMRFHPAHRTLRS